MSYGKELVLGKAKDAAHGLYRGDGVAGWKYQLYVSMCCVPNIPEISRGNDIYPANEFGIEL